MHTPDNEIVARDFDWVIEQMESIRLQVARILGDSALESYIKVDVGVYEAPAELIARISGSEVRMRVQEAGGDKEFDALYVRRTPFRREGGSQVSVYGRKEPLAEQELVTLPSGECAYLRSAS